MQKKPLKTKSILLVMNNLEGSGIKTSFLNLLSVLEKLNVKLDVLIFKDDNNSRSILSRYKVNIIKSSFLLKSISFKLSNFKSDYIKLMNLFFLKFLFLIFNKKKLFTLFLKIFKNYSSYNYDYAISFTNDIWKNGKILHYNGVNDFVLNSVKSKNKVSWIHNDPLKLGFTKTIIKKEYSSFTKIVNVSRYCEKVFLKFNVIARKKCYVLYNFLDINFNVPKELNELDPKNVKFISSSRIEINQKRIDRVITSSKKLVDNGFNNFSWEILGSGRMLDQFKNYVIDNQLTKFVKFLGKVHNPLYYIQKSDFFIQTSDYEAHSLSLLEAKYSKLTPVVMNYNGVKEVLSKNEAILVNFSEDDLFRKLSTILRNPKYYRKFFYTGNFKLNQQRSINFLKDFFELV